MDRTIRAVVSGAVAFVVAYAVGSLVGDRKTAVRVGLFSGVVTGLMNWLAAGEIDDRPETEAIEIDIDPVSSDTGS